MATVTGAESGWCQEFGYPSRSPRCVTLLHALLPRCVNRYIENSVAGTQTSTHNVSPRIILAIRVPCEVFFRTVIGCVPLPSCPTPPLTIHVYLPPQNGNFFGSILCISNQLRMELWSQKIRVTLNQQGESIWKGRDTKTQRTLWAKDRAPSKLIRLIFFPRTFSLDMSFQNVPSLTWRESTCVVLNTTFEVTFSGNWCSNPDGSDSRAVSSWLWVSGTLSLSR